MFDCSNEKFRIVIQLIKSLLQIIHIVVPIGLIIMGTIDFGKSVMTTDPNNIKKGRRTFIKRVIAAMIVFLIVAIVNAITALVGNEKWKECWGYIPVIDNNITTSHII